jgi:hypothetical protein
MVLELSYVDHSSMGFCHCSDSRCVRCGFRFSAVSHIEKIAQAQFEDNLPKEYRDLAS